MDVLDWKLRRLYNESVDNMYKPAMVSLKTVFKKYSGRFSLPTEIPFMSQEVGFFASSQTVFLCLACLVCFAGVL